MFAPLKVYIMLVSGKVAENKRRSFIRFESGSTTKQNAQLVIVA